MDLTLVILAAGLGTRYGGDKQLEAVGPNGETLFDYGIYDALGAGFTRVVIVTRRELEPVLKSHVAAVFSSSIDLAFAFQELSQLPAGYSLPAGRSKPWGTGHAVLAAQGEVHGPFIAMNADDFYGGAAFQALGEHLRRVATSEETEFAAAGYRLNETLSPHGGVSRAVCEIDSDGYLARVTEVKRIDKKGGALAGVTVTGEPFPLSGDETVSMNLWAATTAAFPILQHHFERFLEEWGDDVEAEFFLSESVNDQIAAGEIRVKVIPTPGPWLGVTYQEDKLYVVEELKSLVKAGHYPEDLSRPPGS
jgi:hypothetical protein